jgi:hypothetical protein
MWGSVLSRRFRGVCLLRLFREALSRAFVPTYFPFAETPQVNSLINVFKAFLNAAHMYVIYT